MDNAKSRASASTVGAKRAGADRRHPGCAAGGCSRTPETPPLAPPFRAQMTDNSAAKSTHASTTPRRARPPLHSRHACARSAPRSIFELSFAVVTGLGGFQNARRAERGHRAGKFLGVRHDAKRGVGITGVSQKQLFALAVLADFQNAPARSDRAKPFHRLQGGDRDVLELDARHVQARAQIPPAPRYRRKPLSRCAPRPAPPGAASPAGSRTLNR